MNPITGKSIIHVTTEFASAKAGGLGIVVNDVTKEQAIAGNTVSVLVPFFIHKGSPAYDFISGQPRSIETITIDHKGGSIEAEVHTFDYSVNDSTTIEVMAIKPTNKYSYLTEIQSPQNPYTLSDEAINKAIDIWAAQSPEIKDTENVIIAKLNKFRRIKSQLERSINQTSVFLQEEFNFESNAPIRTRLIDLAGNEHEKQKIKNRMDQNKAIRMQYLDSLKKKQIFFKEEQIKLLKENILPGYDLDGILFKIVNEKAHIISMLNSQILKKNLTEQDRDDCKVDFVHLHHFGEEAVSLQKLFRENIELSSTAIIKTLHSLNVNITHLDSREHPINQGILNADVVHLVSNGSLNQLEDSVASGGSMVYESKVVSLESTKVAQNGIDVNKFSLESLWREVIHKHEDIMGDLTKLDFSHMLTREKKHCFKLALSKIIESASLINTLKNSEWTRGYNKDKPVILFVGRLSKEKGYHRLECAAISARESGATLAVMGYGDPIFEAEMISKYPEVIFLNSREDQMLIGPLLRGAADFSLLTSDRETAGLVLLEGQASGSSVITSNIPGPISIANPETVVSFELDYNGVDEQNTPKFDEQKITENLKECLELTVRKYYDYTSIEGNLRCNRNIDFAKKHSIEAATEEMNDLYVFAQLKAQQRTKMLHQGHASTYTINYTSASLYREAELFRTMLTIFLDDIEEQNKYKLCMKTHEQMFNDIFDGKDVNVEIIHSLKPDTKNALMAYRIHLAGEKTNHRLLYLVGKICSIIEREQEYYPELIPISVFQGIKVK